MWNSFQNKAIRLSSYYQRAVIILILHLVFSLVACGKEETVEKSQSTNEQSAPSRKELIKYFNDTVLYKHRSSEFNIAVKEIYASLDPHGNLGHEALQVTHALYSGLLTLDPLTGKRRPALAEYWEKEILDDNVIYTFTLRDSYWSDGSRVNSTQVAQSLLRAMSPQQNSVFSAILAHSILGGETLFFLSPHSSADALLQASEQVAIDILDEKTISIHARTMEIPILELLAYPQAAVIPIEDFRNEFHSHDFSLASETWNGAGAYIPVQIKENVLELVQNKAFWTRPLVKKLKVHMGLDAETQSRMYSEGVLDWIAQYPHFFSGAEQAESAGTNSPTTTERDQHRIFSSLIMLDIPTGSKLLEPFQREDLRISPQMSLASSLEQINRMFKSRGVADMVFFLRDSYSENLNLQPTDQFFFPYQVLMRKLQNAGHVFYLQSSTRKQIEAVVSDDAPITKAPVTIQDLQEKYRYLQLLRRYMQRTTRQGEDNVIRLGHDKRLSALARFFSEQYFEKNGIAVEVIELNALHSGDAVSDYDIALRLYEPGFNEHYALFLTLWFANRNAPVSQQNVDYFLDFAEMSRLFLKLKNDIAKIKASGNSDYYQFLYDWNYKIQEEKRYIPVWYYARGNRINSKKFKWWSVQEMSWHPLYP